MSETTMPPETVPLQRAEAFLHYANEVDRASHTPGATGITDEHGHEVRDMPAYAGHLRELGIGYALVSIADSLAALLDVMANPAVVHPDDPLEEHFGERQP